MFDRVEAFTRDVAAVASEAELAEALGEICREMGFRYFALTHHLDIRMALQPAIRLDNYPPEWVRYFDDQKLGPCDPVHRGSHLTSVGFAWSQLPSLIQLTARDYDIFERASRTGIGDGFTVPAHVPGESNGSCSFATARGMPVPEGSLALAQLVGAFAFEAARRLWRMRNANPPAMPRLTERQRDCVIWAASGKTDWEISRILGVSQETVIMHLKDARDRYGVAKRGPLIVRTLFDGTIGFNDVLKR
jgi:LuxR family quorum-sensing system transcriptional regulator CciR